MTIYQNRRLETKVGNKVSCTTQYDGRKQGCFLIIACFKQGTATKTRGQTKKNISVLNTFLLPEYWGEIPAAKPYAGSVFPWLPNADFEELHYRSLP